MRKLTQTRIEITPFQLVKWWITIILLVNMTIVNPLMMVYLQVGLFSIYKYRESGVIAILLTMFLVSLVFGGVVFIYYIQYKKSLLVVENNKPMVKQVIQKPVVSATPIENTNGGLLDVTTDAQSMFLKPNAHGIPMTVGGNKEGLLYHQNDIKFDFKTFPHGILYGSSGAGKSSAMKSIINILNKQLHYPQMVILDPVGQDYPNAMARTNAEIRNVLELIQYIAEGRSREAPGTKFKPLLVFLEESEYFWAELNLLKRKDVDEFNARLGRLILTSRKLNVNFWFIAQTGATSNSIATAVSNNVASKFYMRMETNASMYVHKLGMDIKSLQPGIAYYNRIENFVRFENVTEMPHMNALTLTQLETMANNAKRKHHLELTSLD